MPRPYQGMRLLVSFAASVAGAVMASAPASAATVSPTGVRAPDIAVNAGGVTVVAWSQLTKNGSLIETRVGRSPAKLGRIQRMSPGRAFDPQVAVGADGTAAVAWY